jgi:hypothetical protein
MTYLKDLITDKPTPFVIDRIGDWKTIDTKKGKQNVRTFEFRLASSGEVIEENIFETTYKYNLSTAKEGDRVMIWKSPEGWNKFDVQKIAPGDENFPPPAMSNYEEIKRERQVSENLGIAEMKEERKVMSMICHGFMKAAISNGKTPTEAQLVADEAEVKLQELVDSKLGG